MPVRNRKPNDLTQQIVPLILLAVGLVTTNRLATFIDDESVILDAAAQPVRATWAALGLESGLHKHPPLYDILLHFWLSGTGGAFEYLRIPSILFFVAGLFLLSRASRQFIRGTGAGIGVIWVGLLWPFGFHFGRLATWYSFSFFLVAGLTVAYFKYLESQTTGRWVALLAFSACLIWTTYFGWAILGCLAVDQILRWKSKEPTVGAKALLEMLAVLCVLFLPLVRVFLFLLRNKTDLHLQPLTTIANLAFNVYSFFVSESVAPWIWRLSVPAGLAVLLCLVLVVWWIPSAARRYLIFSAALMIAMALIGILQTKYLFTIAPWILLPVGVAIEATKPRWATFGLAASLLIIGGIGWYGIYSRRFYSAPRFIEPWQEVATDAAANIGNGATVIADHPSFLLYLTYVLRVPPQNGPWKFEGVLPDTVKHPQVYSSAGWLAAGHPTSGKMILVRGGADPGGNGPIDDAAHRLDQACGSISSRLRMRDEGYKWKQRFFPQLGEPQWRIEIREYDCNSTNSKQIYPLPPR